MTEIVGLDIGGAHLKLAQVRNRRVVDVRQLPCPLWQGLDKLFLALGQGFAGRAPPERIAVTMTGELADIFANRAAGVRAILDCLVAVAPGGKISTYTVDGRFASPEEAKSRPERVASANWHGTAKIAAAHCDEGLLLDIGSTTTDVIPFRDGQVRARGTDDATRMTHDELVYTGVVRTPVMAVARQLSFAGEHVGVMAEHFATMADVYRVTGQLPSHADQHPSADGRGKSVSESRARLARMIGFDFAMASDLAWSALAHQIAARQLEALEAACHRVLSAFLPAPDAPIVGAGVGRFIGEELASRLRRPYRSVAALIPAEPAVAEAAADCAPSAAVALLLAEA
ncbi:MAG TPA: hydantoinase/oxoprolinase family protein [Alphaproteobacteria bacterium]|nr:hydantoinase/oxoprolinase family protein [Alphaproteobacteria bacterium]